MSHFAVLVIGDNPEKQLAPYHEFECTGWDDEYVKDVDITQDVLSDISNNCNLESALSNHGLEGVIIENESQIDKSYPHQFGYAIVKDGKLIKAIKRTNPNSKWDWYTLGGRYSNRLQLKSGQLVNKAKKGDIDFEKVRLDAENQAKNEYSIFKTFMSEHDNQFPKTWLELRKEYDDQMDIVRSKYNAQSITETIRNHPKLQKIIPFGSCPFDYFGKSEADFIKRESEAAGVMYAVIKDEQWLSKGKMGWFGVSSDDMTQEQWNSNYWELINSLPDDTILSVYDCHI